MPLNRDVVGKTYESAPFEVNRREAIYYALACGEDNGVYFDHRLPGGIIAPPMYAVVYGHGPVSAIIADRAVGLSFRHVVHYAQTFTWLAPVFPGDVISNRATITRVDFWENGGVLGFEVLSTNQHGTPVVKADWAFFDKSAGVVGAGKPPRSVRAPDEVIFTVSKRIPAFQTFVYAEASGDRNGIHIDSEVAKSAGLPGIIVHGLSTMAMCQKVAVDHLCGPGRDPRRLSGLSVTFARPVFPGQTLTFQGFSIEKTREHARCGITAVNEDGKSVLSGVECRITG